MAEKRTGRTATADGDERLRRLATNASLATATVLIVTKLIAYWISDSVSLLSSLIDSSTDLMASVVAFVGVREAMRPADTQHRFGHGKAEAVAAMAQAAFIGGSAALLAIEAIRRLITPEPVNAGGIAVGAMVLSIVLTAALVTFQRHVVRRTGSIAVGADKLHYSGDILMNMAVIAAILLTEWTGVGAFDTLFGIGISAFLVYGASRIVRDALDVLMDHELPQEERDRIVAIVRRRSSVAGVHDLRTRRSGAAEFIELHMEIDPLMTVAAAHDIADQVERDLCAAFPKAEVLIHQEPSGLNDERLDARLVE